MFMVDVSPSGPGHRMGVVPWFRANKRGPDSHRMLIDPSAPSAAAHLRCQVYAGMGRKPSFLRARFFEFF